MKKLLSEAERPHAVETQIQLSRASRAAPLWPASSSSAPRLSGCIGYDGDFDRGYQVDQQTLDQVKVGATTKPQALALMGTPSTTSTVGGDAWYYIGQKMPRPLAFMPAKMTDQTRAGDLFRQGRQGRPASPITA